MFHFRLQDTAITEALLNIPVFLWVLIEQFLCRRDDDMHNKKIFLLLTFASYW
jgi:hypothetical protein